MGHASITIAFCTYLMIFNEARVFVIFVLALVCYGLTTVYLMWAVTQQKPIRKGMVLGQLLIGLLGHAVVLYPDIITQGGLNFNIFNVVSLTTLFMLLFYWGFCLYRQILPLGILATPLAFLGMMIGFLAMHRITRYQPSALSYKPISSCLWLPIRYYLWQRLPRLCCGYKSANSNVKPFTVSGSINYLHSKAWKRCCLIWLLWVLRYCRFRCCWALLIPPIYWRSIWYTKQCLACCLGWYLGRYWLDIGALAGEVNARLIWRYMVWFCLAWRLSGRSLCWSWF